MSLFNVLVLFVYLQLSTIIFGHENSTNNDEVNGKNISIVSCQKIQFDEIKLAEVLHRMREPAINTVEITVTVASANRTRIFPEMVWPWASEIGRTLISLISIAKTSIFFSLVFTFPLEVGIERVSIEVTEEPIGCLLTGKEGSDQIFNYLLNDLFLHMEDKDKDKYYKLCRPHDIEGPVQFNCCRITGRHDENLKICADYSSIVLEWARLWVIIILLTIFSLMTLPLLMEHMLTCHEKKFYKTSFSHMSLTSIVSMIFFEGDGPVKFLLRRCVFVGLMFIVFLPNIFQILWLKIVFGIWAFFFCVYDLVEMTWKKLSKQKTEIFEPQLEQGLIECFTVPLSTPFIYYKFSIATVGPGSKCKNCCTRLKILIRTLICALLTPILITYYLCIFIFYKFLKCFFFPYGYAVLPVQGEKSDKCLCIFAFPVRFLTLGAILYFTWSILIFVFSVSVGLILNGEIFNPVVAIVMVLIVFFWRSWQFSVEAQCLRLKTTIINVCKDKAKNIVVNNGPNAGGTTSSTGKPTTNARSRKNRQI
ncbi:uncharacterized protein LOC114524112 [Dendronephthya gigantea]|uniref:uncharacterized protein LOC114524112 n=1 Tax=Dendronephthya gigantea TaxID=151771 RepID=UPI00106CC899|nr:uncharacterized protein LOC114524112 [Dendronephthya gigantea]